MKAPHVLIAFAKGFAHPKLFEKKINTLLKTLETPEITVIQDDQQIAHRYFKNLGIITRDENPFPRVFTKQRLREYSHVVVFWDGYDLVDLIFFSQLLKKPLRLVPIQITKVRNKDNEEPYDFYIGRGTPWGNPFPIGIGGVGDSREEVIKKYKEYFYNEILPDPDLRKRLESLRGYRLGCHCKPKACHGDIIAEYLNTENTDNED